MLLRGAALGLLAGVLVALGVPWYVCVIGGCALLCLREPEPEAEEPVVVYLPRPPAEGDRPGLIDLDRARARRRSHR